MSEVQPDEHIHSKQIPPLPEAYTTLPPVTAKQDPTIPPTQITLSSDCELVSTAVEEEKKWQNNTHRLLSEGVLSIHDPISWAAFHSNQEPSRDSEVTIGSLLPLFPDDSKSVAMIRTTTHARKQPLTQPGRTYSPPKTGQWTIYHQQKQPCYSTQNGQYTKVDMYGGRHLSVVR
ncbi:hypothetical protein PoB_005426100 [Plakobranchus ocellatus]|uniref:Uncharacterized protein n=1 Tax=Plakobranchus ocellatus TaxID=259542 RepID=A0AAV4C4V6_9GAST|nr:hypothetical protein PoB_005426100 [Plakobranchus ocellatus]